MPRDEQPGSKPVVDADERRHEPDKAVDHTRQGESSEPALPSDRDQSTGATSGVPSPVVQQGHRDVKKGLDDTSRGTEADQAYDKLKK